MATPTDRFDGSRIAALQVRGPAGSGLRLSAGETPVAVQPRLSSTSAPDGARRLNAFAGRALTAPLLQAEQDARARRLALLNRALSAGVVGGLGLAFDDAPVDADLAAPRRMSLDAGSGLTAGGEEVIVPAALGFDALALPVVAPPWLLSDADDPPELPPQADGRVLLARATGRPLRTLAGLGRPVPRAGLVLLEPVEHRRVEGADPFDQCERDLDAEAFEDQVRQDAARLVYYPWPGEWLPLPAPGDAWRNLLAHRIFEREAALLAEGGHGQGSQAMPWHAVGVPLALVAFDADWRPLFADRAAVVRAGGRPRGGSRFLWQARIDQLGEHLAEAAAEAAAAGADSGALARQLQVLPPAGLLPRDAVDARRGRQRFFPATLDVTAVPLPIEQLDHVFEASAGLAPVDLAVRDRLVVYVPVPQTVWTPDLLLTEVADADGAIASAIERDVEARADWLRRRQRQRLQQHALELAADGPVNTDPVLPAADDPARLEEERFDARVPAPAGLLHRSARATGLHQHYLDRATRTLALQAGDQLYAWVLLDSEAPPRQLMLQWQVGASWDHRAYWGADLIAWGQDGTPSRLQQSTAVPPAVPTTGTWQRLLMVPAALGLEGATVNGVAFTLFDGQAVFGPCGVLREGAELPWLDQATLDSGTQRGDGEAWLLVDAAWRAVPFEADFDTSTSDGVTTSTTLTALVADPLVATRQLAPVTGDDSKLVPTQADAALRGFRTLPQLIAANGLRATVADLASRIDEADDAINLGYLRVQTDLYRLRQTVLKSSQASRFAVSPALTQIADLDNASATREQLSDFYDTVRTGKAVTPPADRTAPPVFNLRTRVVPQAPVPLGPAAMAASAAAAAAAPDAATGLNITSNVGGIGMAVGGSNASIGTLASLNVIKGLAVTEQPRPFINVVGAKSQLNLSDLIAKGVLADGVARAVDATTAAPTPKTVTDASALTGKAEIRTTSIASRLERPRAIEAKDFTVATRLEVIGKLASLGLDLDELDVPGVANEQRSFDPAGQPLRAAPIKLKLLRGRFAALASDPDPEDKARDESAYFLGGVDLSDHTIAVLRAAEGIVRGYRDALARCSKALAAIDGSLAALAPRLALIERELAESRQDVATARALLAEEMARATALNAQRDAIVDEHATFLAFARPRASLAPAALPWRALDNALEPDAVPACLAAHDEPPGDVAALLDIVRQAPADWFPAVRAHLALLDSHGAADRVLAALPAVAAVTSISAGTLSAGLAGIASQKTAFDALRVQAEVIGRVRAQAQQAAGLALGASAALNMGLVEKLGLIARGAGLADLAAAAAGRDELNRRITAELGRIAQVAACLHARLSGVRAAVRLDWAERFSQYDAVGDLGDLSMLPHMAELPRDDRIDITELAAWLRGRADRDNPRAVALMATLVRVCVLAASHSPAGQLLTGRLVRPVPLNPGVRFEVQPSVADRLRVGMAVRLFDPALGAAAVAAQAVVVDVVGGIAQVQVMQVVRPGFVPGVRASVQFHLK